MAQLNDLVVTGKSRFLNEINGKIDWSNILSKPSTFTPTIGNSASTAMAGNTNVNNVTQTPTTTDATYELLFSGSANNTTSTEGARKSQYATFNPNKKAFTFGSRASGSTIGSYSYAEGENVTASGDYSHAEGRNTVASNDRSHAEGNYTTASGFASHAEGQTTYASDSNSHAEGSSTTASGYAAHSEGYKTIASDNRSHAEGSYTTASGYASHAEGEHTIANHTSQHVFGQYNIPDPSTASSDSRGNYVEIVGNGTVGTPSTARTLDWDGNETLAGSLNINGGNVNLGTSSSASDDSGDIAFFYGNGQEKARIFSANEFTSYDDLNYRCYKKDGTLLGNSHLATRKDIVPISGGKAITTSTSMSYTGLSFVVPPHSVVSVTVRAVWQNGWPKIIGVSTSSSSQGSSLIASNVQYSGVGHLSTAVNYYNASSSNLTLYIWAQYSSASSNTIQYWGYSQRYDA